MTSLLHTPKLQLMNVACIKASKEEHAFNMGKVFNKMSSLSDDLTIIGKDGCETVVNRLVLGVSSPTLRPILFDQLNITPTIILPDLSSSVIKHLVNFISVGSSVTRSIAFKELHEITEAAKMLQIDLTDIDWEAVSYEPKVKMNQVKDAGEEASEMDVDRDEKTNPDKNNESLKILEQSHELDNKAVEKVDQSSISNISGITDGQAIVNDNEIVEDYGEYLGVMNDQVKVNNSNNRTDVTDDKLIVEVMEKQGVGAVSYQDSLNVQDSQPTVMADETIVDEGTVLGDQSNVDIKDIGDLSNGDIEEIGELSNEDIKEMDDPSNEDIQDMGDLSIEDGKETGDLSNEDLKDMGDLSNENIKYEPISDMGDHTDDKIEDKLGNIMLHSKDDQLNIMHDQALSNSMENMKDIGVLSNKDIKDVGYLSKEDIKDTGDLLNEEITDISDPSNKDIEYTNDLSNENIKHTGDLSNEDIKDMDGLSNEDIKDEPISDMGDQTDDKIEDKLVNVLIHNKNDQVNILQDKLFDAVNDQVLTNGMDTTESSCKNDQSMIKDEPASFGGDQVNSVGQLNVMLDQAINMDEHTSFTGDQMNLTRVSTDQDDSSLNLICKNVVKDEIVENLIKEENDKNECNSSFETAHENKMNISEENIRTDTEQPEADGNLEASFDSVSDFDSSFETLNETSMVISNGNAGLRTVCQVCSKFESNYSILKTHYIGHFKNSLRSQFGDLITETTYGAKKNQNCVMCKATFTSMRMALRHIGISHNKLNEILIYEGLTPLPDSKRKAEKDEELSKKIKTDPSDITESLLSDISDTDQVSETVSTDIESEVQNDKHDMEEHKINDHENVRHEQQAVERIKIDSVSVTDNDKIKNEENNSTKRVNPAENTEILHDNHKEAEEVKPEFTNSYICQICHKIENPGIALWNHYITSHYSSKRIVQEFGHLVSQKKCLLCSSKHTGTAAALKHVAVKHEKLNDLLILDGLVPLSGIGPKSAQEETSESNFLTKNRPEAEKVLNNPDELKPFKNSVENHNKELKTKVEDVPAPSVETSVSSDNTFNNDDDEIENDDAKDLLVCQMCNLKKSSITLLQKHYINSHFRRKIKSRFEQMILGNYCEDCDIEFRSVIKALIHVGIVHNKLNEILDEEGYLVLIPPKEASKVGDSIKSMNIKNVVSENISKNHAEKSLKDEPKHKDENVKDGDFTSSKMPTETNESEKFKKSMFESKPESPLLSSHSKVEERKVTTTPNQQPTFTCDVCYEKFDKKNDFIRHTLLNRHYFTCDKCETNFRKKDKFESHKSTCTAAKEQVKNAFETNSDKSKNGFDQSRNDTANSKVNEPDMKSKADPIRSTNKAEIEPSIQMRAERKRSATVAEITCEICGEKFNNKKIFFRHCLVKNHYFTCDVCGKSFKKKVEYLSHQKNCTM